MSLGVTPGVSVAARLLCLSLCLVAGPPSRAVAEYTVSVSETYSAIDFAKTAKLRPGEAISSDRLLEPTSDSRICVMNFQRGSIALRMIDAADVYSSRPRLFDHAYVQATSVPLPQGRSNLGVGFGIVNVGTEPVDISVTILRVGHRDANTVARVRESVEIPLKALDAYVVLPKITLSVAPCGTSNAVSTPTIVICTELIADLVNRGLTDALHPIELHEIAHSLLNVWGLPGYDNEDVADEFAAMFSQRDPRGLSAFVTWLEQQDSVSQAVLQLVNGDRHTASIQRARNVMRSAQNRDLVARWTKLLAPYARSNAQPPKKPLDVETFIQKIQRGEPFDR